jgi:tetratricopeptide (TPR) repeat protein
LLARALNSVLLFIEGRKQEPDGKAQVRNAIALAEACAGPRPDATATVFRALDKSLKDIGDKHLALKVAELSIQAAREAAPRTREVAEGEAHALICGRSWVYQRINRLADARVAAEESLRCGKDINWGRNTAYCMKCLGRLLRLEAEQTPAGPRRKQLLEESVLYIRDAIARFSEMPEFGPNDPEVGDCYSLVGRTFLHGGRLAETDQAVRQAIDLISDQTSKDYLDLVLLDGDLQVARGDRRAAEGCYTEALQLNTQPNADVSEMRARAYFKRGLNYAVTGEKELARKDLREATALWKELGEMDAGAEAEWNALLLDGRVSAQLERRLESEVFWVRVKVITTYEQRVTESRKVRWARREQPGSSYWEYLIKVAKEQFRIEVPSW